MACERLAGKMQYSNLAHNLFASPPNIGNTIENQSLQL